MANFAKVQDSPRKLPLPVMLHLTGYARVSTEDQPLALIAGLNSAGCADVLKEQASGGNCARSVLARVLERIGKGTYFRLFQELIDTAIPQLECKHVRTSHDRVSSCG